MFLAFARWPMLPGLGKAVIRFDDLREPLAKNTRSTTPIPSSIGTAVTWRTHLTNLDSTSSTCSTPEPGHVVPLRTSQNELDHGTVLGKTAGPSLVTEQIAGLCECPAACTQNQTEIVEKCNAPDRSKILLRSCKTLSPDSSQQNRSTPENFSNRKGGGRYEVRRLARWSALDACFAVPWRALWDGLRSTGT